MKRHATPTFCRRIPPRRPAPAAHRWVRFALILLLVALTGFAGTARTVSGATAGTASPKTGPSMAAADAGDTPEVTVVWFYFNPCGTCDGEAFIRERLDTLPSTLSDTTVWRLHAHNTYVSTAATLMERYQDAYGVPAVRRAAPVVFLNGLWLQGEADIREGFADLYRNAADNRLHPPGLPVLDHATEATSDTPANAERTTGTAADMAASDTPLLVYFSAPACAACEKVSALLADWPPPDRQPGSANAGDAGVVPAGLRIEEHSLADPAALVLLRGYMDAYGVPEASSRAPILFYGNSWLSGDRDILARLPADLAAGKAVGTRIPASVTNPSDASALSDPHGNAEAVLAETVRRQTAPTGWIGLFATGLLNGLNPCSLSMMLFFLALIASRSGGVMRPALWFIAGKFTGFCLLGFGLVQLLGGIPETVLSVVFRTVLPVLALVMVLRNLLDWQASRKEAYAAIHLQLPDRVRGFNHRWIRKLRPLAEDRRLHPASFGLGMLISGGDFLCTGQVYLATLLYAMRAHPEGGGLAAGGFLLYGLAFVLPLLPLAWVVQRGKGLFDVSEWVRTHMPAVKLANAGFFLAFGLWMAFGR